MGAFLGIVGGGAKFGLVVEVLPIVENEAKALQLTLGVLPVVLVASMVGSWD